MFERFTSPSSINRVIARGDIPSLRKLIRGGCRLGRRETYDPWKTPLDVAVASGSREIVQLLLDAEAKICGTSLIEAMTRDDIEVFRLFQQKDMKFFRFFHADDERLINPHNTNPRLNRWTSHFSVLDYALALGSEKCAAFLLSIGLVARQSKLCLYRHHAVFIHDEEPYRGGRDNLWVASEGFYCLRCGNFIK